MATTVSTIFRVHYLYIETLPQIVPGAISYELPEGKVQFQYRKTGGASIRTIDASMGRGHAEAKVELTAGTDYEVRAVWDAREEGQIIPEEGDMHYSTWHAFNTGDGVEYSRFHFFLRDANNEPIDNAEVSLSDGSAVVATHNSRPDGLVYFQHLAPGTYEYTITKTGYTTLSGTVILPSEKGDIGKVTLSAT